VGNTGIAQDAFRPGMPAARAGTLVGHWNLAFLGIIGYVVVEYTRLPAMYPVLQVLQLGKVVTIASLVGLLISPQVRAKNPPGVRRIDTVLIIFIVACLLSFAFAYDVAKAWPQMQAALLFCLIYFLIGRIVNNSWRLKGFLFVWLLCNLKLAQFVIRSYFSYHSMGVSDAALGRGVGAGSTGFFANSNDFGLAMVIAFPVGAFLLYAQLKRWQRVALLIYSTVCFLSIFFCSSRGAIVGIAMIVLIAFIKRPKKLAPALMIVFLAVGVGIIMPQGHKDRLRKALDYQTDPDAMSRITFWKAGLRMFSDHPLTGVGVGNFPVAYEREYAGNDYSLKEWVCHSIYIQSLSELGLSGTVPFLILVGLLFYLNSQTRRQLLANSPNALRSLEYWLATGLDFALVGYLSSGAFLAVLFYPHLWILLGLSVGLSRACARNAMAGEANNEPSQSRSYAWQAP